MIALRPYQDTALAQIRDAMREHRRVLLQSPTGSGKTVMFAWLARQVAAKGRRICILAHRRELLAQIGRTLGAFDLPHVTIDAQSKRPVRAQVSVASVQTLARRLEHYADAFDLLIVDEAHHSVAGTWGAVLAAYPKAYVLGVTATPERLDGRGLIDVFQHLVLGPGVRELIDAGHLSDYRAFVRPGGVLDLKGIKMIGGDYDQAALAERMSEARILGDAVEHYRSHADGRPATAFCVTVAHAETVAQQFRDAGYRSVSVDGSMNRETRDARISGLANGAVQVLTSCELICEGLDIPGIAAAILLRPTQSLGLYLQQVGRSLRPKPEPAVILDHAGNVSRHGLPCAVRAWSLESKKRRAGEGGEPIKTCPICYCVCNIAATVCPGCGHMFEVAPGKDEYAPGQLVEIKPWAGVQKTRQSIDDAARQCHTFAEIQQLRVALGFKKGWEFHVARGLGWQEVKGWRGDTLRVIAMVPPVAIAA